MNFSSAKWNALILVMWCIKFPNLTICHLLPRIAHWLFRIVVVVFILKGEHILLGQRYVWHVKKVGRVNCCLWGVQQSELPPLAATETSLWAIHFICLLHHAPSPQSNTLYPCHWHLLHLSHWYIGSLQKVTTQGLLTPGFRDNFDHPTCWSSLVAFQHFTPIPLRPLCHPPWRSGELWRCYSGQASYLSPEVGYHVASKDATLLFY